MAKQRGTSRRDQRAEREAHERMHFRQGLFDLIARMWDKAFQYGAYTAIAYFAYLAIVALAGKHTVFNSDFLGKVASSLLSSCGLTGLLGLAFGGGATVYGVRQKRLRQAYIKKYHPYQADEERSVYSDRSSSNLTPQGETRPEDL